MTQIPTSHLIVAQWGLAGTATAGKLGYRSQNPWQALEHYMESKRGNAATLFATHGATTTRLDDSGGSVWKAELSSIPTRCGFSIDDFAKILLDGLVAQNTRPEPDDFISVYYADNVSIGRWEWRL